MDELTLREVAAELGVHYMTAYRYVRLGMLPAHKKGTEWRVTRSDLAAMRAAPRTARASRRTPWDERLLGRLVAGDEPGAWGVVEAALAGGLTPDTVLLDVVSPAMHRVGELWVGGVIGIHEEHIASAVVTRILGQLGSRFRRRGLPRGTLVLGTTADEQHGLPMAIAADIVRSGGFDVVNLGPRVPPSVFAAAATEATRLVATGLSVTTDGQDSDARETIASLHDAVDVPVILGGASVKSAAHARSLGADEWAATADHLVEILEKIVGSGYRAGVDDHADNV